MKTAEAVILVGHGAPASDTPKHLVSELKALEAKRRAKGIYQMSAREAELDRLVRTWPRTPETDPYKSGLEKLADQLRKRLKGLRLVAAYNEFCSPSLEESIAPLVAEGVGRITLVTTMFTPGGSHSEREIPEIVEQMRQRYPGLTLEYAWPFELDYVADFLAGHLEHFAKSNEKSS